MAVVLSGCTTDWNDYDLKDFDGLFDLICVAPVPILGICAGHQLIGYAHGASWGPLGFLQEGEIDSNPNIAPGRRKESGFISIRINAASPLFRGFGQTATFFQSHYWQLQETPAGFITRARSTWSEIQAIEHAAQPVFGVQFHPERYYSAHPDGKIVLHNFFALARNHFSTHTLEKLTDD